MGAWTIQPMTGDCIIFPSHLEHEAATSFDKQDRYSLAFNYFPKGTVVFKNPSKVKNMKHNSITTV